MPRTSRADRDRNDTIFILDYSEGISGPRNIDGLGKFGEYLRTLDR